MKTFAMMTGFLSIATYLVYHFTFWIAFGILYLCGMVGVAVIAGYSRRRSQIEPQPATDNTRAETAGEDQLKAA